MSSCRVYYDGGTAGRISRNPALGERNRRLIMQKGIGKQSWHQGMFLPMRRSVMAKREEEMLKVYKEN